MAVAKRRTRAAPLVFILRYNEDFSAEDDLLCRMKVRCTDDAHTVFVATVVGDGVFSDGTSWTYRLLPS